MDRELPEEVLEGMSLPSTAARALEEALERTPEDLSARLKLLGYYLLASVASQDAAVLASRHVLWLIAHVPEAKVLETALGVPANEAFAAEAGRLWRAHVEAQPRNVQVLINAARFFSQLDRPFAEHLRYRLRNLDPERFADFSIDFDAPIEAPPRADEPTIAELEDDLVHAETDRERAEALVALATRAFRMGDVETTRARAEAGLDAARAAVDGSLAHRAELLLGLAALEEGDLGAARTHLLDATRIPHSPALQSFGPDMSLARRLLERGIRAPVLEYFEACRELWTMGHALLDAWSADVAEGRMPNFLGSCRLQG
ncbi:MAG: hypothetical protein IRZ16_09485 [Myxococcaceae bacterium]|nr:hypothetical protein [Myxococcaceae bacterium]